MATLRTPETFVLAKLESTYGTAVSLAGSDALTVVNFSLNPVVSDIKERTLIRNYAGNFPTVNSNVKAEVTFTAELIPSGTAGTAPPTLDKLLKACGLTRADTSTTNTYTPDPDLDTADSLTIGAYIGKHGYHRLTGCRGSFSIDLQTSEVTSISFTFEGIWEAPSHVASPPTPTFSTYQPEAANSTNTTAVQVHSFAGSLMSFTYNHANALYYSELLGGSKSTRITDRKPSGSLVLEAPTYNTKNFHTLTNSSTTGNITWQNGQTAGNKITFLASYADLDGIGIEDNEGYSMVNLNYRALPSSGNDEMSLKFH